MNEPKGQFKELVKFLRWIWFIKLFGPCMRLAAGLCAIMSVAIIWSEATSAFRGPNDMLFSIVGLIFNAPDLPYTVVEVRIHTM